MKKLEGTGVALVTPFNEKGKIDFPALRKLLKHTARGVDYFVVMGTTGESATLSPEEKNQVLQFVLENNPHRLPVVYGIGGNNTQAVLDTIKHTGFSGVAAVLSVSPYYNKPSQAGIVEHFHAVADACPVPVILYNVPGRTSSNLTAETTLRLAEHHNIIGIKEASGNIEQCMRISRYKPKNFMLISGDDLLTAVLYSMGGQGVISVLANAFPLIFKKVKEEARKGNYLKASQQIFRLLEINGLMYEEGNPTGVKQLLAEMNICRPYVRLPLVPASDGLRQRIATAYQAIKKG
ncbi:MAG: 4-hydroxy-tetrahydrodipicolinate synthase [Cyclobacteriaceae bacterium]|nr:MAG: 4-hydroxy-tetrahydrodipicolinate synthase [Cyclobacteriaceae bacterium]